VDAHRLAECRSIELHRAIAERLRRDPGLVQAARLRVAGLAAAGTLSPWYADEWKRALSLPTDELCALLVGDTEVARTLRQTTPFTAVVPPRERWGIWRRVAEEARSGRVGEGHGAGGEGK